MTPSLKRKLDARGISETEFGQIWTSIREDNCEEDTNEMLEDSTFSKDEAGITVTYDNGVQDRFEYRLVLFHKSNYNPHAKD